jgi:histidinol phosphatase-like enzyme (inositol monophosphatase family)
MGGELLDDQLLDDITAYLPIVLAASGELALRWFREELFADDKGGEFGYDPVTEADRGVEDLLRAALAQRYPDHQVTGEERGTTGPDGRYRWMIDPIDGTKAFVSGMPLWGTLVGLLDDGIPVAGWLHQPYLQETFAGVAGTGTLTSARHDEPVQLRTRPTTKLADAVVYSTHDSMFRDPEPAAAFDRLRDAVRLQRWGGDCYSYGLLALGHLDLVVENGLKDYDIVPLIPIVQAAGGVVTDLDGDLPVDGGFVVAAATAELHEQALSTLRG